MKKFFISASLVLAAISGFSTTWTVTSVGFAFSQDTLVINFGDSVLFQLGPTHTGTEVSQTTWNANANSPVTGFNTPFGGGLVLPAQLQAGTHWYVCTTHALMGMKGVIIVQSGPIGITDISNHYLFSSYPTPFSNKLIIETSDADVILVYNLVGEKIKIISLKNGQTKTEIDVSDFKQGVYFFALMKNGIVEETKKLVKE